MRGKDITGGDHQICNLHDVFTIERCTVTRLSLIVIQGTSDGSRQGSY